MKHIIDLHGCTHKEAVKKVESSLIGISLSKYWEVEIITGKSKTMQDVIIEEVLKPNNFFYYTSTLEPGAIIVIQDELLS